MHRSGTAAPAGSPAPHRCKVRLAWGRSEPSATPVGVIQAADSHAQALCGPDALGVVAVADVPGLRALRARLLPLARELARAAPEALEGCEDPASRYTVGWSVGREVLASGAADAMKASFYANPLQDDPLADVPVAEQEALRRRYPSAGTARSAAVPSTPPLRC